MLSKIQELLQTVVVETANVRQQEYLVRCRKEFAHIGFDAHEIAHIICEARAEYIATLAELATEGKRLGAWAAEIRQAKLEMEKVQTQARLDDAHVKGIWDEAVAILRQEANAYAAASDAREARKGAAEKALDQAYLDMRMGRADIIERVQNLRPWLHSEEESSRRAAIKQATIAEIMAREEADKVEAKDAQEALNMYLFGLQVAENIDTFVQNLEKVMPHLIAESEATEKKAAFVTRMKTAKLAKRAKKEAEEAEFQKLIEEEAAAKLAEENKAKAALLISYIKVARNLDEVRDLANEAHELDKTINVLVLLNEAEHRFVHEDIQKEKVEVCHVNKPKFKKGRPQDDCGYQMVGKKVVAYETVEA